MKIALAIIFSLALAGCSTGHTEDCPCANGETGHRWVVHEGISVPSDGKCLCK